MRFLLSQVVLVAVYCNCLCAQQVPQNQQYSQFSEPSKPVPPKNRREDVQELHDGIRGYFNIELIHRIGVDEIAVLADGEKRAELESDLESAFQLHLNTMSEFRALLKKAEDGLYGVEKVKSLIRELSKYREASDSESLAILRKGLNDSQFKSVVDGAVRTSGPDYFEYGLIADSLRLTREQVNQLREIRTKEISLIRKARLKPITEAGKQNEQVTSHMKEIAKNSIRIFDSLTEEQFSRIGLAKGILEPGEGIDDFLIRRKDTSPELGDYVRHSKVLTARWNKLFPSEAIE